ncbi:protein disulfide-isomerase A3 [Anthonomus grandis grandis]|uniref:protein disulfide-isomerase A3 n=1 Tax=Anthonomus grandis grandis TaxID=2921223 RepID=UPI0021651866|nr:protein disulfide-isomerase A3 [Anthonomus grandis grandis]
MLLFKVLPVFLLASVALAKEEDVLELTDADFDQKLAEHDTALVMFYAPWCGHCKRLKPEYAKAAEDLLANDPPVVLVKVDCTEGGKETCNKNSVSGYPTLKIFRNGEVSQDYNGPREASGIVKYMKAQVGPASKEIKSWEELEKFLSNQKESSIIGFFEKESDLKGAFLQLANKLREKMQFAHSTFKDVLEKQGVKDGVFIFRASHLKNKFEPETVEYKGAAESAELNDFITNNFHGLVGVRKSDNQRDFKNPLVTVYYGVDYVKNPKGTNYWRNRVLKVAKEFEGKLNFAIASNAEFTHELNEFGIEGADAEKPRVAAKDAADKKYVLRDEFSVDNLLAFVNDFLEGSLEPYIKSEPIPETQEGSVITAVAKNFDEVVTNNGKDTLIEFYAPWCGHCKKLAPAYEELAEKLKDEDVAIVKMDATANDVTGPFDVRGFPTIYWAPKDQKDKPVRYEGGREVNDFLQYIAKEATNELKGWDRSGKPKSGDKTEL